MARVTVANDYPVPVRRLWDVATDLGALAHTMRGLLRYDGLPTGRARAGMVLDYQVSLLGLLPPRPWRVEVIEQDEATHRFVTREHGAGLRRWDHTMIAVETPDGSRLIETVEVEADAAWQTPIFFRLANHIYRRRHRPRLELLLSGGGSSGHGTEPLPA
jgi:hypothetical protein